jgi:hypothetical protein
LVSELKRVPRLEQVEVQEVVQQRQVSIEVLEVEQRQVLIEVLVVAVVLVLVH